MKPKPPTCSAAFFLARAKEPKLRCVLPEGHEGLHRTASGTDWLDSTSNCLGELRRAADQSEHGPH